METKIPARMSNVTNDTARFPFVNLAIISHDQAELRA